MLTAADALLQDVLALPDLDWPRLVLADWLEDNGDPDRAELIRVQCELARWEKEPGRPKDGPERAGWLLALHRETTVLRAVAGQTGPCPCEMCLRQRERELMAGQITRDDLFGETFPGEAPRKAAARRWREWSAPAHLLWPDHVSWPHRCIEFRRGFVAYVRCPLAAWQQHGPALVRAQPLGRAELTDRRPRNNMSGGSWWYREGGDCAEREALPACLFDLLPGVEVVASGRRFAGGRAAADALSAALLLWAKAQPLASPRGANV